MIQLIVGLGNPGAEYSRTRHNAGFWFVDRLADQFGAVFSSESRFHGEMARINRDGIDCRLLKPATFMNDSGRAVQSILDYFHIESQDMLVAHDEIDLDAGIIRLKKGGGHGGHNGLRDIISCTGKKDFLRLRIGVGHPGRKDAVTPHVLGKPGGEDQTLIEQGIDRTLNIMPGLFAGELQKAMSELHSQ